MRSSARDIERLHIRNIKHAHKFRVALVCFISFSLLDFFKRPPKLFVIVAVFWSIPRQPDTYSQLREPSSPNNTVTGSFSTAIPLVSRLLLATPSAPFNLKSVIKEKPDFKGIAQPEIEVSPIYCSPILLPLRWRRLGWHFSDPVTVSFWVSLQAALLCFSAF